jgi:hypothetical protein
MTDTKYIGTDVHKESISMAVRNDTGKSLAKITEVGALRRAKRRRTRRMPGQLGTFAQCSEELCVGIIKIECVVK